MALQAQLLLHYCFSGMPLLQVLLPIPLLLLLQPAPPTSPPCCRPAEEKQLLLPLYLPVYRLLLLLLLLRHIPHLQPAPPTVPPCCQPAQELLLQRREQVGVCVPEHLLLNRLWHCLRHSPLPQEALLLLLPIDRLRHCLAPLYLPLYLPQEELPQRFLRPRLHVLHVLQE